jgi:hypothetical protein
VFESSERLAREIRALLDVIRELAAGRYACLIEPGRTLFESEESGDRSVARLRSFLERKRSALFSLPSRLASGEPMDDLLAEWEQDGFFMAFLNGRVALVVACPEAEPVEARASRPLRTLADRLLRYNEAYRMDAQGRGLFFGSPRLDLVVVERPGLDGDPD